ncbi:MAG: hypothetical protein HKN04_02075, partial [Rhodothermaceae bacterium]|nr:hypothetical protein [Rhodothermaceae bacterium]
EEFDTYLIIRTPTGEQIDVDDYEGNTTLSLNEGTLPVSGWYEIRVTSFSPGETGSYLLEVTRG